MFDGVDVSYAQGNYRPGAESFVICNASRANIGLAVGSMYRQQVANARAAGKHVGHYFFNGNIDPTICADFFVNNLTYQAGDSLWLDVESEASTGTVAWSPTQALAFLVRVKARLGVMPGVYLNRSLMDGQNWSTVVAFGAALWIAYYNPTPPPIKWWPDWSVWQYTSTPLDMNKAQSMSLASVAAAPLPPGPVFEDDEMIKIYSPNRQSALIGPGYAYPLDTDEKAAQAESIATKVIQGNDRQYDLWMAMATQGRETAAPAVPVDYAKLATAIVAAGGSAPTAEQIAKAVNDDAAARLAA
jgi:hypothetical protein